MTTTIDDKLNNIECFLKRIESKMDNFMGFKTLDKKEQEELLEIKKKMDKGNYHTYYEIFN
jgi:hypothetical protein